MAGEFRARNKELPPSGLASKLSQFQKVLINSGSSPNIFLHFPNHQNFFVNRQTQQKMKCRVRSTIHESIEI
jgi:hypothetical protein